MNVFALADFHLSFDTPGKSMEIFGKIWKDWTQKIATNCHAIIQPTDLLLIAGDISWASTLDQAKKDLEYIASLPGTKVIIKGNHDFWWPSYKKLCENLPASVFAVQNNSLQFGNLSVGGTRLWDSDEYSFANYIDFSEESFGKEEIRPITKEDNVIFQRELLRLDLSLKTMPSSSHKIVMTHYPPIAANLKSSKASSIIESYKAQACVFGHLHSIKKNCLMFGKTDVTNYVLTACDYCDFKPVQIL
jgi:predicted phosphohydrolase